MNATSRLRLSSLAPPLLSLGVLVFVGCNVGPTADVLAPFRTGQGIDVTLSMRGTAGRTNGGFRAEVLEVRREALLVNSPRHPESIALVSYRAIGGATFDGLERLNFGSGRPPSPAQQEELRLLSRYPQGVSDELLQKLLLAYHQDELRTIR